MAYDEALAERIRTHLAPGAWGAASITEKKMFGGVAWMVQGNMAVGIVKDDLMVRVGPDAFESALKKKHARPMDFTGRPMKGYVYVAPAGVKTEASLTPWLERGVEFAMSLPAKSASASSKKKKKKKKKTATKKR